MPSERSEEDARINGYIISELETTASLDPSLPFPKKEYEELCRLHGCVPVPTDGIPPYETEFAIGYRRGIVNHKVGKIRFSYRAAISKIRMKAPSSIMMRLQTTGTRLDAPDTLPMVSRISLMWKRK